MTKALIDLTATDRDQLYPEIFQNHATEHLKVTIDHKADPLRQMREDAVADVYDELCAAQRNWPPHHSAHEGYGILMEEVRELEQHVFTKQKNRDLPAMRKEAIQVAAMALRFAIEVCNEAVGRR